MQFFLILFYYNKTIPVIFIKPNFFIQIVLFARFQFFDRLICPFLFYSALDLICFYLFLFLPGQPNTLIRIAVCLKIKFIFWLFRAFLYRSVPCTAFFFTGIFPRGSTWAVHIYGTFRFMQAVRSGNGNYCNSCPFCLDESLFINYGNLRTTAVIQKFRLRRKFRFHFHI